MNDRFKFRAWNSVRKIMITDKMESERFISFSGHVFLRSIGLECLGSNVMLTPESLEVMQSTGLRDKNDVLIYEGDIFEYGSTNRVPFYAVCEFEGCSFGLRVYESVDVNWFDNELAETAHLYEVIGNIHENSELLNKVKI